MPKRLALAALLALSCDPGFEPQYRVADLRILGVRAEVVGSATPTQASFADATTSDTLQLEALVVNPRGRAGLTVRWFACLPPRPGDVEACREEEFLRNPETLVGAEAVFELPRGAGSGERPPAVALTPAQRVVVDAALAEKRSAAVANPSFQCSVYVEVPIVVVAQAEDARQVALKLVRVTLPDGQRLSYERNRNPPPGVVQRDPANRARCEGGTELSAAPFPSGRTVLCARAGGGAVQEYAECGPDGPRAPRTHEDLSWQWFVTGGEFPEEEGIGNATGHDPDFERPPEPFTLWVVLRDGRGGESWMRRDVGAAP